MIRGIITIHHRHPGAVRIIARVTAVTETAMVPRREAITEMADVQPIVPL